MSAITASSVAPARVAFRVSAKAPATRAIAKVQLRAGAGAVFMRSQRTQALRASRMVVYAAEDTLQVVREIISEQLGTDIEKVAADAKFVDLGADSLDTVEIMMALEEKFSITLDEEGAEKISTVQEAADLIAAQIK